MRGKLICIEEHNRKFFKDLQRARKFCNSVDGSLHYKGSYVWIAEMHNVEYPEDYDDFEYLVIWRETK